MYFFMQSLALALVQYADIDLFFNIFSHLHWPQKGGSIITLINLRTKRSEPERSEPERSEVNPREEKRSEPERREVK